MSVNTIVETAQEFIARKTEEFQRDGKDMKLWHLSILSASIVSKHLHLCQICIVGVAKYSYLSGLVVRTALRIV